MIDQGGFRALASPTRRTLLRLVRDDAQAVGVLAERLEISQPAVSQHLAVLREAGLVTVERDGRRRLYRADVPALCELRTFFDGYWSDAIERLADAAERVAAERAVAS